MPEFLSPEWIAALDAAVSTDERLRAATADVQITVQQTVTGTPQGDVCWHVVVDRGSVRVQEGPIAGADVTFTQDDATARAIGTAALSAQAAFMLGKLRIGGDVARLIEHRKAFDGLEDLFDDVRAVTAY